MRYIWPETIAITTAAAIIDVDDSSLQHDSALRNPPVDTSKDHSQPWEVSQKNTIFSLP